MQPQVVLNLVGLTGEGLKHAPRLLALARVGWTAARRGASGRNLHGQASMLTGQVPSVHGIVGNGWLFL